MPTDPTVLHNAAIEILGVLETGAADASWEVERSCVTAGEPSWDCNSLHVWVSDVDFVRDNQCQYVMRVEFGYGLSICTSADARGEDCDFWLAASVPTHDAVWAVSVALVNAALEGLCGNQCSTVGLTPLRFVPGGDLAVYIGQIRVDLSPIDLGS